MKVFIQNEAGSRVKHWHNEKTLELKGAVRVSRPYPFPYGFILETTADDGLNVDCFVLTKQVLKTGQVVDCQAVALMEQIEDAKEDHNVLAVLRGESVSMTPEIIASLTDFVLHVFEHVPGKKVSVGKFLDDYAARDYVSHLSDLKNLADEQSPADDLK